MLQSMGSQRVGHNWATEQQMSKRMYSPKYLQRLFLGGRMLGDLYYSFFFYNKHEVFTYFKKELNNLNTSTLDPGHSLGTRR